MNFGSIGSGSFGTAIAQQRTFSAPSTLRSTPVTGEHRASEAETFPRAHARVYAPPLVRSSSSPWLPSPSVEQSSPASMVEEKKDSPVSPVQGYIARKLSLSNYVAPNMSNMVTPPMTPPSRSRSASLPGDVGTHSDSPEPESTHDEGEKKGEQDEAKDGDEQRTSQPAPNLIIIGGQPATSFSPTLPSEPASTASAAPKAPSSLPPLDLRIASSELGAELGVGVENTSTQLLSPPSSPVSIMSPLALGLSGLSTNGNNSGGSGSSTPTNVSRPTSFPGPPPTSPLDSSYAALIRQWCFTGSPSGSPTNSGSTTPAPALGISGAGSMGGFGRGYGAGFPGFGVGGMADAGIVGGEHLVACFS